jgi:alpha/beta superfamily hydrolase
MAFSITAGSVELEALLREPRDHRVGGAAVFCHPHPLYGGDMNNRVVFRAAQAAVQTGFAALRFNFRGVGASTGSHDQGRGEKDDVRAALAWLRGRYARVPLALAGFSFGAWVGLQVGCEDPAVSTLIGMGLPLSHYDFSFLRLNPKRTLLIAGSRDGFCPQELLTPFSRKLPAATTVHIIRGADHFFGGQLELLQDLVGEFLAERTVKERRS